MATERRPVEFFPPGDYIREELEFRGLGLADLEVALHCSPVEASALLEGTRPLTDTDAIYLSRMLGTGSILWTNLEQAYRSHLHRQAKRNQGYISKGGSS